MAFDEFEIMPFNMDFGHNYSPVEEYLRWQDYLNRIIVINEDVNNELADKVIIPIMTYNKEDDEKEIPVENRTPITLYINTNGGDIDVCFGIISAIQSSNTPVHTIALSKACSAGAFILMAGHKRFAYGLSTILIHEGQVGVQGDASKTEDFIEFHKKQKEKIKEFILKSTKISEEEYNKNAKREWYLLGEEALELGIVDELV